jgi:hypothetical protein
VTVGIGPAGVRASPRDRSKVEPAVRDRSKVQTATLARSTMRPAALAALGLGLAAALLLLAAGGLPGALAAGGIPGASAAGPLPGAPGDPSRPRVAALPVSAGAREGLAPVVASTPAPSLASLRAAEGRLLGELDLRDARRVAVLGASLRAELFGFGSSLLRLIRIGDARFTVVGVLEPVPRRGGEPLPAPDPNRAVFVPASAAAAHLPHAIFGERRTLSGR